jgi:hypothetical protein
MSAQQDRIDRSLKRLGLQLAKGRGKAFKITAIGRTTACRRASRFPALLSSPPSCDRRGPAGVGANPPGSGLLPPNRRSDGNRLRAKRLNTPQILSRGELLPAKHSHGRHARVFH